MASERQRKSERLFPGKKSRNEDRNSTDRCLPCRLLGIGNCVVSQVRMVGVAHFAAAAFLALTAGVNAASDAGSLDQADVAKLLARMNALEEEVATLKSERQQYHQQQVHASAEVQIDHRRLAMEDLDSFSGIQVAKEKGKISFGPTDSGDAHILRTGSGQLMVVADNTTFSGGICMYSESGTTCLEARTECASVDVSAADDYSVGLVYSGANNVHHGQFLSTSDVHCAYGYVPSSTTTWECAEFGGIATPTDQICRLATCSTVNITGYVSDFSGGAHDSATVTTGDSIDGTSDCATGHYENTEATWICPKDGGIAVPSDSLCLCDSTSIECDPLSQVTESGVYTITGLGSDPFDAYVCCCCFVAFICTFIGSVLLLSHWNRSCAHPICFPSHVRWCVCVCVCSGPCVCIFLVQVH